MIPRSDIHPAGRLAAYGAGCTLNDPLTGPLTIARVVKNEPEDADKVCSRVREWAATHGGLEVEAELLNMLGLGDPDER